MGQKGEDWASGEEGLANREDWSNRGIIGPTVGRIGTTVRRIGRIGGGGIGQQGGGIGQWGEGNGQPGRTIEPTGGGIANREEDWANQGRIGPTGVDWANMEEEGLTNSKEIGLIGEEGLAIGGGGIGQQAGLVQQWLGGIAWPSEGDVIGQQTGGLSK